MEYDLHAVSWNKEKQPKLYKYTLNEWAGRSE